MIGNRIKLLREEKGLKQDELAKKIAVSPSAIGMYERNLREPNNEITLKLADFFEVSTDYLMGNSDFKTKEEEFLNYREKLATDAIADSLSMFSSLGLSPEQTLFLRNFSMRDVNDKDMEELENFIEQFPKENRKNILSAIKVFIHKQMHQLEFDNLKLLQKEMCQYYMCPVYGQISAGQPNWVEENIEGRLPIDTDLMGIINPEEHFFLRVNGESMNKVIKNGAFALIKKQDYVENGEIAVVLVNGFDATLKKFTKQGELIILEPQSNDETFKTQVYDKNTSIRVIGKYIGKMEINK